MKCLAGVSLLLASLAAAPLSAQSQTRKALTQDTYDLWRRIEGSSLSPNGRWAAYTLTPVIGDGEVVLRSTSTPVEHRVRRGFTGRPVTQPAMDSGFTAPPPQFSSDSRWLAFLSYAPQSEFARARRSPRDTTRTTPRASLTTVDVTNGRATSVARVKSFRLARASSRYLVYLHEPSDSAVGAAARDSAAAPPPAAAAAVPGAAPRPIAGDSASEPRKDRRDVGSPLVVRDLATGAEVRIEHVMTYAVDDSAHWLAYAVSTRAGDGDGVFLRELSSGRTRALLAGAGHHRQLAFDRVGRQVAFVSDAEDFASENPRFTLYHATVTAAAARPIARPGVVSGMMVSDRGKVEFTRDGSAVLFGVAPPALDSIPADSLADKAVFDLWHYRDARLQPQQRVEAKRDRDRSYTTIYHLASRRVVQLAGDSLPQVTVSDDGRHALAITAEPYRIEEMWGEGGNDVHLIDATTGTRRLVAQRLDFEASMSPGSRYVLFFDEGRWFSYAVASGKLVDLTGSLAGVRFDQETWDTPSTPEPWGVAGWTRGDQSLLVYDRYDVWELDPTGERSARIVTDSVGVRGHLVLRLVDLEPDERYIDPSRPLLLRAFDDETKASGFYRDRLLAAASPPERIVMAERAFGTPQRARDAEMYLLTQSTVTDFPNLWTGSRLDQLTRISDGNPQQAEYRWVTAELVKWRSDDGIELKGILYKPDDFDPSKQYPMVVYYYEQLSDGLHDYIAPAGRNVVNGVVYGSQGYLVFFPDIAYSEGYPGPSALKSIVPGVQSLIARGYVHPQRIGIAGQSWGGYQTAYIITQTNLFAAAVPNATVANMTSAYGGIRWATGIARAWQYEKAQSRIGGSLWEYPLRYIENSPLFYADRIQTPVLMMANDNDGAVPWYQGIELFVALRRFGKEAYLINYNGDGHNPRKRANQKDIDMRMQQFFAHHLKGEPKPDWMIRGIPFLQKGRDQLAPAPVAESTAPSGTGLAPVPSVPRVP